MKTISCDSAMKNGTKITKRIFSILVSAMLLLLFTVSIPAVGEEAEEVLVTFDDYWDIDFHSRYLSFDVKVNALCDLSLVVKNGEDTTTRYRIEEVNLALYQGNTRIWASNSNKIRQGEQTTHIIKNVNPGKYVYKVSVTNFAAMDYYETVHTLGSLSAINQQTTLSDKKVEIGIKESKTIKAYTPTGITVKKWTSSKKSIAKVSKDGKITGVDFGKAKITAQLSNGKKISCNVIVRPTINKTEECLAYGEKTKLKALNAGKYKAVWSSSNPDVAKVDEAGNVTAGKKTGKAIITAAVGKNKIKCNIIVKAPLTLELVKIEEGSIYNKVWINFTNNSNKKITYVELDILQYNNAGMKLEPPFDYRLNEDLAAHTTLKRSGSVHGDTKKVKLIIEKVTFADGSTWVP